jgi:cell division transport system ATP-binding protein
MIEFVKVSKTYPTVKALQDINFEIAEGEFTFLVGPSGSGKSTIIKLLIREEEPTEGEIYFYDTNVTSLKEKQVCQLRREISVVFQDFKLLPNKNLYENIAFVLEVSDKKDKDIEETVNYVLDLVGLADRAESFPDEISGGEKQKVAIARAVANNPKVLIADEPTGNLDPETSWDIIKLLTNINEWGTTVIMATHGSDIVDNLGRRVIELDKGKIISDKKGGYPNKKDSSKNEEDKQSEEDEKKEKKKKKELKEKITKDKKTKKKSKKKEEKVEEKEFEIVFTTKQKPKKRKGSDVVDIHKLKLNPKTEEILIKNAVASIKALKKLIEDKELKNIKDLKVEHRKQIKQAMQKLEEKD